MSDTVDTAFLAAWLNRCAAALEAARDTLCAMDGEVGDGDHGISMADGLAAADRAVAALGPGAHMAAAMHAAARAVLETVGATVGPLYASAFLSIGARLGDGDGVPELLAATTDGIAARGKASAGERTMIDAWARAAGAAQAARQAGGDRLAQARAAQRAAEAGAAATKSMIAMRGRAVRLGGRCLGHTDPGAYSAALMVAELAATAEATA